MNVSNEQVAEEAVVRVLRATRANDAQSGPARHAQQTDRCPNVARFATVIKFYGKWSEQESRHIRDCPFCRKVFDMFTAATREASREDTVVDLKPDDETHIGITVPKPPGDKAKPA